MGEHPEEVQEVPATKRQRTGDGPATSNGGRAGGQASAQQNQQQRGGKQAQRGGGDDDGNNKKKGGRDPRVGLLQMAVRGNNLQVAMKAFREMIADGVSIPTAIINSLMFLACGGEQWERYARGLPPLTETELAAAAAAAGTTPAAGQAAAGGEVDGAAAGGAGEGGAEAEGEAAEGAEAAPEQEEQQGGRGKRKPKPKVQKKRQKSAPVPSGAPPSKEEMLAAVEELWGHMQRSGLAADQGTYLGLARREALRGDPEAALHWAKECDAKGKPVQLRLFHPAQVGFCLAGDVAALHAVDEWIAVHHKLDASEYEYARLLEGIAAAGSYQQLRAVLLRMQEDLNQLQPATADHVAAFFERRANAAQQAFAPPAQGGCPGVAAARAAAATATDTPAGVPASAEAADEAKVEAVGGVEAGVEAMKVEAEAGVEAGAKAGSSWSWQVLRGVEVEEGGACGEAGGSLRVIDLQDAEWESFAASIADLAKKNMAHRAADFDTYTTWYERHGPYDILVDAANVAYFGQNHEGGGFQWRQIEDMYDMLRQRFPEKKILVMLHRKRLNDQEARKPQVQAFITRLQRAKSFYHTPPGANDDWFWLYACVRAKHAGLLVSNDLLRDHIFGLLRPKHFLKWKQRHIAQYDYNYRGEYGNGYGNSEDGYGDGEEEEEDYDREAAVALQAGKTNSKAKIGGGNGGKEEVEGRGEAEACAPVEAKAESKVESSEGKGKGESKSEGAEGEGNGGEEDSYDEEYYDEEESGHKFNFKLSMPCPYTACVQQLQESGAWMLPVADGSWLCVRPQRGAGASGGQQ